MKILPPRWGTKAPALRPQNAGVFYALAVVWMVFGLLGEVSGRAGFASFPNASNVLDQAAFSSLLVIFMTVVLVSGNFDLSVASTAALSAEIALHLVADHSVVVVLGVCLMSGALIGTVNGVLVQVVGINAFIVTLATQTAVRGVVFLASGGSSVTADTNLLHDLTVGFAPLNLKLIGVAAGIVLILLGLYGRRRSDGTASFATIVGGIVVAVVATISFPAYVLITYATLILLAVLVMVWLLITTTVVGRRLHAVGSNAEAARLSGINASRYRIGAFIASGTAAAFVGVMFAGKYESMNPQALVGEELVVLTAAILGGTSLFGGVGSVVKSVVGALILASLANGMNFQQINSAWQGVIEGAVLVAAAAAYTLASRRRSSSSRISTAEESSSAVAPQTAEAAAGAGLRSP